MNAQRATFVIRLTRSTDTWTGVVERVRTGEKHRVEDIERIGDLIARMVGCRRAIGTPPPTRRNDP